MSESGEPPFAALFDDQLRSGGSAPAASSAGNPLAGTLQLLHEVLRLSSPTVQPTAEPDLDVLNSAFLSERVLGLPSRFQIQKLLGKGGFGIVFLAKDELLQREVAIKIPRSSAGLTDDLQARFLRESRAASRLNHQNIVRVLDSGETQEATYQISEYVKGERLRDLLNRKEPISEQQAADFIRQLADAIQHAHERKVLHRDIKPENILLEAINAEGSSQWASNDSQSSRIIPRLTDFGLARLIDEDTTVSRSGVLIGTPKYMSPEQLKGDIAAHRESTDIYSLGVVLYEILTGAVPFPEASTFYARLSVIDSPVISPRSLRPELSKDLESICLKCLEVRRERRYANASDLRDDLIRFLDGRPILARPRAMTERITTWILRHQIFTTAASLILVLGFCIIGLMWRHSIISDQQNKRLTASLQEEQLQRALAAELKLAADQSRAEAVRGKEEYQEFWWASRIREAYGMWEKRQFAETSRVLKHMLELNPQAADRLEWSLLKQELDSHFFDIDRLDFPVREIRAIPGTDRVVVVGDSGRITIVDARTQKIVQVIETNLPQIHALAISADASLMAVGGTILDNGRSYPQIYRLQTGKLERTFEEQKTTIESILFNHDASQLIVACRYEPIKMIDLATGKTRTLPGNRRNQWIDITTDGDWLVTQETTTSLLITSLKETSEPRRITTPAIFYFAAIIPGTHVLAVARYHEPQIDLIDLTSGIVLAVLKCHSDEFSAVGVSPDGRRIFAAFEDGSLASFLLSTEFLQAIDNPSTSQIFPGDSPHAVVPQQEITDICAIANDSVTSIHCVSNGVYFAARDGAIGAVYDDQIDRLKQKFAEGWILTGLGAEGRSILAARNNGSLIESSCTNRDSVQATKSSQPTQGTDSPNQKLETALPAVTGHRVRLFPSETEEHAKGKMSLDSFVAAMQLGHDKKTLALGDIEGNVSVYNLETNISHPAYANSSSDSIGYIRSIAISEDSRRLAWVGLESVLNITGTATGSTTTKLKLPASGLSVTFSPDQMLIAVGGRFDGLQIFDAKNLTSLPTVPRVGDVTSLTYAQDSRTIFSGHKDGTIRYERFEDHNIHVVRAHTGQVMSILLLEEFNLGLSIDEDSDIALWYISDGTFIGRLFTTGLPRKKNGRRTARLVVKQNGRQRTLQTVIEVPRYYILEYQLLPPNSSSVQVD